jgi:hypothetical protein
MKWQLDVGGIANHEEWIITEGSSYGARIRADCNLPHTGRSTDHARRTLRENAIRLEHRDPTR